jgi:hypothetical protein
MTMKKHLATFLNPTRLQYEAKRHGGDAWQKIPKSTGCRSQFYKQEAFLFEMSHTQQLDMISDMGSISTGANIIILKNYFLSQHDSEALPSYMELSDGGMYSQSVETGSTKGAGLDRFSSRTPISQRIPEKLLPR